MYGNSPGPGAVFGSFNPLFRQLPYTQVLRINTSRISRGGWRNENHVHRTQTGIAGIHRILLGIRKLRRNASRGPKYGRPEWLSKDGHTLREFADFNRGRPNSSQSRTGLLLRRQSRYFNAYPLQSQKNGVHRDRVPSIRRLPFFG